MHFDFGDANTKKYDSYACGFYVAKQGIIISLCSWINSLELLTDPLVLTIANLNRESSQLKNDVGQSLQFNFCNYFILVFSCKKKVILGLGDLFPYF